MRQLSYVVFNILSFDFLADHNLQDHREKYFFAKSEEIGQHQYPEQLISPPFFLLFWSKHTCFQGFPVTDRGRHAKQLKRKY